MKRTFCENNRFAWKNANDAISIVFYIQDEAHKNELDSDKPAKGGSEAEIQNFKELLNKIKDIMDGICSQSQ